MNVSYSRLGLPRELEFYRDHVREVPCVEPRIRAPIVFDLQCFFAKLWLYRDGGDLGLLPTDPVRQ
jgi:hypothetical protein